MYYLIDFLQQPYKMGAFSPSSHVEKLKPKEVQKAAFGSEAHEIQRQHSHPGRRTPNLVHFLPALATRCPLRSFTEVAELPPRAPSGFMTLQLETESSMLMTEPE